MASSYQNYLRSTFILLSLGLLSIVMGAPYPVQAANDSQVTLWQNRIDNFAQVSPNIWRGAAPSDISLEDLAKHGVKTIVDLRMDGDGCEHEHVYVHRLGVQYVHIPMKLQSPSSEQIVQFLNVVNNRNNLPVFIHCRQGADRTGVLVGIYRILVQGWSFDKVYEEMRDHHFKPFLVGMKRTVAWFARDSNAVKSLAGLVNFSDPKTETSLLSVTHDG
jgi:tyrosine-protein phosphatase SIW14